MKNLSALLILAAAISLLGLSQARADKTLYVLSGSQLTNFSIQVEGAPALVLTADWNLQWIRSAQGLNCEELFSHHHSERCYVKVEEKHSLHINGFGYPLAEPVYTAAFQWGDFVSNAALDAITKQAAPETDTPDIVKLKDVQMAKLFVEDDMCFTKEVRFFADSATKEISRLWFERVVARCP